MNDLAVIPRVLPPADVEELDGLLDEALLDRVASHAVILEKVQHSKLLAAVPNSRREQHALTDAINVTVKTAKSLEAIRVERVAPLNEETKRVNALFAKLIEPLKKFRADGDRLVIAFDAAEKDRIRREEEETERRKVEAAQRQAAAEAKAAAAVRPEDRAEHLAEAEQASMALATATVEAPMPAPKAYRGDEGTVAIRERWVVLGISNPDAVPALYRHDARVLEALRKVLQAAVTGGARDIEGVAIGTEQSTRVTA